jgi:DNA-binding protein HU-beta
MAGKARRTTHRSTAGKKLYAVRDASGRFKDIQTYERAHRADLAHKSKAELAKGGKKKAAKKKAARKKSAKKTSARKA